MKVSRRLHIKHIKQVAKRRMNVQFCPCVTVSSTTHFVFMEQCLLGTVINHILRQLTRAMLKPVDDAIVDNDYSVEGECGVVVQLLTNLSARCLMLG